MKDELLKLACRAVGPTFKADFLTLSSLSKYDQSLSYVEGYLSELGELFFISHIRGRFPVCINGLHNFSVTMIFLLQEFFTPAHPNMKLFSCSSPRFT